MISLKYINPIDNFNYITYVYDTPKVGNTFDANNITFIITDIVNIHDNCYDIKVKLF